MAMTLSARDGNGDFKYMIDDLTLLYFGARCTYRELLESENCSIQFQRVIRNWLLRTVDPDTTLESHLYYLQKDSEDYDVFRHLKARIRVVLPVQKKGFGGKEKTSYQEQLWKLDQLVDLTPEQKQARGVLIRELQISRLGLMSMS